MSFSVYVVFHSLYGYNFRLAKELGLGTKSVEGANVSLFAGTRKLINYEILEKIGTNAIKGTFAHIPIM